MKVSAFKFYRKSILTFLILGSVVIIIAFIFTIFYGTWETDGFIMMCGSVLSGLAVALFPVLLYYKQLTFVYLNSNNCVSYSFFRKKLCEIDYNKQVYYSFFDVKFVYASPVKFIAISNAPFLCDQNAVNFHQKKFYGTYNQKQIIVFPYDNKMIKTLNLNKWHMINSDTENTGGSSVSTD